MKNIIIIFFCFFLIFLFLNEFFSQKNNFQNIDQNIDQNSNTITVYLFYAPWCHHCKTFKPQWDEFKKSALSNDIKTVDVNSDDNNDSLINKYNIQGFPTIIIAYNNNWKQYTGPRTVQGLKQELNISSNNTTSNNTSSDKINIYNFNTKSCGYSVRFQPVWDQFSNKINDPNIKIIDVKCDDSKNNDLCNKFDLRGYPTVLKENITTNKVEFYNGPRTVEGLTNFIGK